MILGKPKNTDNYIVVNSEMSKKLHKMGFIPLYRDNEDIYYLETEKIIKVVENWNLIKK